MTHIMPRAQVRLGDNTNTRMKLLHHYHSGRILMARKTLICSLMNVEFLYLTNPFIRGPKHYKKKKNFYILN